MIKTTKIAIFEGKGIRRHWNDTEEKWYFSVVDVIRVLTNSIDALAYWRKLKERLLKEGSNETVTKCHGLKMIAADGKMRITDVADTEVMLRLIQSIPSPNAEPYETTHELTLGVSYQSNSVAVCPATIEAGSASIPRAYASGI